MSESSEKDDSELRKTLFEDTNYFPLSHQPVWNNEKIITFFDIGGESESEASPQGMTTDQFMSKNMLMGSTGSASSNCSEESKILRLTSQTAEDSLEMDEDHEDEDDDEVVSKPSFDPTTRHFSPEELKPNPIQRKSRKTITKNEDKDDKYWVKRRKNNLAAKRSREARRSRENQISLRASFLEKDNATLKEELLSVKEELQSLKEKLMTVQQQADFQQNKCNALHRNNN